MSPVGPERPSERGAGPERPSERGAGPERPSERGAGPDAASENGDGSADAPTPGGRRRGWVLAAGTLAVIAISIGVGAFVASKGPHREMTKDALPGGIVPGQGGGPAVEPVAGGDLGEIADRAALVARVESDLETAYRRRAEAASVPSDGRRPEISAPAAVNGGTRLCEMEARGDPGDRGDVVYEATAAEVGTPGVVLAFGSAQGADPITVELRAQSDCRLLLQGAIL